MLFSIIPTDERLQSRPQHNKGKEAIEHQLNTEVCDFQKQGWIFPSFMVPVGGRRERCLIFVGALPSNEKILIYTRNVQHIALKPAPQSVS